MSSTGAEMGTRASNPDPEPTIWMTKEKTLTIYEFLDTEGIATVKMVAHTARHRELAVCPSFRSGRPCSLSGLEAT